MNLAQGANAEHFTDGSLPAWCENVIRVFEQACATYEPKTFRKTMYDAYFEERGKTTDEQRKSDALRPVALERRLL